jgi:hypothetical protein
MKDRAQNPVVGDEILLKMFARNSNNLADVYSISSVDIYKRECTEKTCDNPEGNILIESLTDCVARTDTGTYQVILGTSAPQYTIGKYHDVWNVIFKAGDDVAKVKQNFSIYPDLWITSPTPVVYSFDFSFTPNRIRQGSIKWLIIQITPNVPRATDLQRYYENVAISADLKISIEQNCGPCTPAERDLRMIVDCEPVTTRDKVFAYYKLDTTEMDCGIYDVTFTLDFAGNREVSPIQQFQIY